MRLFDGGNVDFNDGVVNSFEIFKNEFVEMDEDGNFVMLGKTFKGLTAKLLRWQTKALLERERARDEQTVYAHPDLVVEIALNDIQASPHYPAGLALRFARVKAYRADKTPAQADTLTTVQQLYEWQTGQAAPAIRRSA